MSNVRRRKVMQIFRLFIVALALIVLVTACATSRDKERGQIYCPACGTEFDALFEKRF
jgi:ABC-type oligopeptide transport system substrate-binding subunit